MADTGSGDGTDKDGFDGDGLGPPRGNRAFGEPDPNRLDGEEPFDRLIIPIDDDDPEFEKPLSGLNLVMGWFWRPIVRVVRWVRDWVVRLIERWRVPAEPVTPITELSITNIYFNFNHAQPVALNIRKNYTTPIALPEWEPSDTEPEDAPAAYSISATRGKIVNIKASFAIKPPINATIQIRAQGGGVLGPATRTQAVKFVNGKSDPTFVTFQLRQHQIGATGVQRSDIEWNWEYRVNGVGGWQSLASTRHRIYEVLTTPSLPWIDTPLGSNQNVWTDVLDIACVWASGAQTGVEVAEKVTQAVNAPAGAVQYDIPGGGACRYTSWIGASPGFFDCTSWVDRVKNGAASSSSSVVNCSDCATIVSTFANAVGDDINQSVMKGAGGVSFALNPIVGIGFNAFGTPNWPGFSYHEVAWRGAADANDPVSDACLKTNQNGSGQPQIPILHTNSVFSAPYRPQLSPAVVPPGRGVCTPMPAQYRRRRPVR